MALSDFILDSDDEAAWARDMKIAMKHGKRLLTKQISWEKENGKDIGNGC